MMKDALKKNVKLLQTFYPEKIEPTSYNMNKLKGLPVWIKSAVKVFELDIENTGPTFLILPQNEIPFEMLMNINEKLRELLGDILLVADNLPAKHRPLLVKFRIPFIYKDESVFAPRLGLKIANFKLFARTPRLKMETKREKLTPFALKLLAGILTKQLPRHFSLKSLQIALRFMRAKVSVGKLSTTVQDLVRNQALRSEGAGPNKTFTFAVQPDQFQRLRFTPFFRTVEVNYLPKNKHDYTLAGENALAHYSNLAEPTKTTLALTRKDFDRIYLNEALPLNHADFGNPVTVQIWKEDPKLFAKKNVLNPIELFFSMQNHPDERVQESLDEMLSDFKLMR